MIRSTRTDTGEIEVTFTLARSATQAEALSVVGEFNNWDPAADPFTLSADAGEWNARVVLTPGCRYAFRYLASDGHWFNDETVQAFEDNGMGQANSILDLSPLASISPPAQPVNGSGQLQPDGSNGAASDPSRSHVQTEDAPDTRAADVLAGGGAETERPDADSEGVTSAQTAQAGDTAPAEGARRPPR